MRKHMLIIVALILLLCCALGVGLLAAVVVVKQTGGVRPTGTGVSGLVHSATSTPTEGMSPVSPPPTPSPIPTPSPPPSPLPQVPLEVLSVSMSVQPESIQGLVCGTPITVTYTATFVLPVRNEGGTLAFQYTTNGGRSSTPASLRVPAGVTEATYRFTWSGLLPPDHTRPGAGGVLVTSPTALRSPLVKPQGACRFPS